MKIPYCAYPYLLAYCQDGSSLLLATNHTIVNRNYGNIRNSLNRLSHNILTLKIMRYSTICIRRDRRDHCTALKCEYGICTQSHSISHWYLHGLTNYTNKTIDLKSVTWSIRNIVSHYSYNIKEIKSIGNSKNVRGVVFCPRTELLMIFCCCEFIQLRNNNKNNTKSWKTKNSANIKQTAKLHQISINERSFSILLLL